MSNVEIARAVRAEITKAEAALAKADALATAEFRATMDPDKMAKAEAAMARATKALTMLHRAATAAVKSSGDVTVLSGGGGGK